MSKPAGQKNTRVPRCRPLSHSSCCQRCRWQTYSAHRQRPSALKRPGGIKKTKRRKPKQDKPGQSSHGSAPPGPQRGRGLKCCFTSHRSAGRRTLPPSGGALSVPPEAWRPSRLGLTFPPRPVLPPPLSAGSRPPESCSHTARTPPPYPRSRRPGPAPAAEGGSARTRRRPRPWPRSSTEGARRGHVLPPASAAPPALRARKAIGRVPPRARPQASACTPRPPPPPPRAAEDPAFAARARVPWPHDLSTVPGRCHSRRPRVFRGVGGENCRGKGTCSRASSTRRNCGK